jgi:hypothetical protein
MRQSSIENQIRIRRVDFYDDDVWLSGGGKDAVCKSEICICDGVSLTIIVSYLCVCRYGNSK